MPLDKQRKSDPLVSFQFALDTGGAVTGYFSEVGGIGSESDVVEHKVVDAKGNSLVQKLPGRLKWTDVSLKRGVTDNMEIWTWRKMVEDGDLKGARKNCTITMFDANYRHGRPMDLHQRLAVQGYRPLGEGRQQRLCRRRGGPRSRRHEAREGVAPPRGRWDPSTRQPWIHLPDRTPCGEVDRGPAARTM